MERLPGHCKYSLTLFVLLCRNATWTLWIFLEPFSSQVHHTDRLPEHCVRPGAEVANRPAAPGCTCTHQDYVSHSAGVHSASCMDSVGCGWDGHQHPPTVSEGDSVFVGLGLPAHQHLVVKVTEVTIMVIVTVVISVVWFHWHGWACCT